MNIPEGILKKEVKSKEQKTKDIEEVRSQWKFRSTLLEACLKGGGGGELGVALLINVILLFTKRKRMRWFEYFRYTVCVS